MPVRVRFAPSPTGAPHIGNVRTALFNYLFARHEGGRIILRVEDTDVARRTEGAIEQMMAALKWLGLSWDEGPDVGGPYGPYVQSERLHLYREAADRLLREGRAYRCFCTPEELEANRKAQVARHLPPRYAGTCRAIDPAVAEARQLEPHVVRLRAPTSGETVAQDALRGALRFRNATLDDPVLLKTDGYPTYHLANVVDDHLMEISHAFRGEEWIPSLPWHVMTYDALGWTPPTFVHVPLLLDQDRAKMSKRHGDTSIGEYRRLGYLPEALVNYVAFLGWTPGSHRDRLSLHELVDAFELKRLSRSPAVFDVEQLNWFDKHYIRALSAEALRDAARPYLEQAFGAWENASGTDLSPEAWLDLLLGAIKDELTCMSDVAGAARFAFGNDATRPESAEAASAPEAAGVLRLFLERLQALTHRNYDAVDGLLNELRAELKQSQGLSGRQVLHPIRVALTGREAGPCLVVVILLLGKERCESRIRSWLA